MLYPTSYYTEKGAPVEGAARSLEAAEAAGKKLRDAAGDIGLLRSEQLVAAVISGLQDAGMSVVLKEDPLVGLVSRVQVDVYADTAAGVEETLLAYAERCGSATEAPAVSYGRCVIERNLEEEWGAAYSWRGRLVLHPEIGTATSNVRAKDAVED